MDFDELSIKYNQIFVPGLLEAATDVEKNNRRFSYYTSADTAMKILKHQELWFRNALVMNDFSEISYGLRLIEITLSGNTGARFRQAVDDIFEGTMNEVMRLLKGWKADWELETYLACISLHDESEDKSGRLSMWRAYGDTALIINNTPLMAMTDALGVFSIPVLYLSKDQYKSRLNTVTQSILINRTYLKELGQETLVSYIHRMLFITAIATKHPGFSEENEWRLFYRPTERTSPAMTEQALVISGVPQIIYALSLRDDPENGLVGADVPNLLNRVIIGPTEYPYVSVKAFKNILRAVNVENVDQKVVASDIPLRSQ